MNRIALIIVLLTATAFCAEADDRIPQLKEGIIDTTQHTTLGLPSCPEAKTVTIFSPSDSTHHYSNGVVMTAFKGTLYCMWQSSQIDEDAPETCVMYSRSTDEGLTWTKPTLLAAATDSCYFTSGGWLATADTLVAYLNCWPRGLQPAGGYTYYIYTTDGSRWSSYLPVMMSDGQPMRGIIEQDPTRSPTSASSAPRTSSQAFTSVLSIPMILPAPAAGSEAVSKPTTEAASRANWSRASTASLTARW